MTAREDHPTPGRRRRPAVGALAAGLAALTLALAACGGGGDGDDAADGEEAEGSAFTGIERDPAPDVSAVALPEATAADAPFTTVAAEDELLLVYFGFTNCPDICPTTMADVRAARADMAPEDAERVDLAMVTVDPARDSAQVLTDYVRSFVPEGHALRTDDEAALREAATAFGADFLVEVDDAGEVEVGHTSHLYAVDDQGRMVLQWPFGTSAEDMRADMERLLDGAAAA